MIGNAVGFQVVGLGQVHRYQQSLGGGGGDSAEDAEKTQKRHAERTQKTQKGRRKRLLQAQRFCGSAILRFCDSAVSASGAILHLI
jgi:hypothetical protein